jgi:FkbM family methyltransferase
LDVPAAAIRITGDLSPRLGNTLYWRLARRRGQFSHRLVDVLVNRGDVVVDAGADYGLFTNRLAQRVGRAGHVHAFEPNPRSIALLRRVKGRRRNITLYECGLSDAAREAPLHIPVVGRKPIPSLGTVVTPQARAVHRTVPVSLVTLDDALAAETRPISFIKCDVEGHEHAVLCGAAKALARWRPNLLIEIEQRHRDSDIHETFALLLEFGYSGYAVLSDRLAPLEEFDVQRDQAMPAGNPIAATIQADYVNDFLFVGPAIDVASLVPRHVRSA